MIRMMRVRYILAFVSINDIPMMKEKIESLKPRLDETLIHFTDEAAKLRTGRAHPALVEGILVDYYGTETPLKQIAGVSIPEARSIVISPWDKGALLQIESAIRAGDLGLNPVNDGSVIRITLPALTEDRRKELVKSLNQRSEEARIAVRTAREDVWKEIQKLEAEGGISEDDKFHGKDELQKVVDEYNKKIEELREKKEAEIMTI